MRFRLFAACAAFVGSWSGVVAAHEGLADGTLISAQPCPANPVAGYADYVAEARAYFDEEIALAQEEGIIMPPVEDALLLGALETPEQVADHLAYDGFECLDIRYASSGLVVAGYLWKPVDTEDKKLPVVIANRGGNRHFGPMEPWRFWGWHEFLKAGYVVLASQYRGGPESEGQDEYGGKDLDDVRALIPLAESLGYADMENLYAWGGSRGGMMTYMLARGDKRLRAIAIRAGLADLFRGSEHRPIFEDMYREMMPDLAIEGRESAYTRRSAVRWADEISAPTIIFHGSDDWRLSPLDATDMTSKLMAAGTPVELHLYMGDTHSITLNRADMMRHAIRFFDRYRHRAE